MFHTHQSHKKRIAWEDTARSCAILDFCQEDHEIGIGAMDWASVSLLSVLEGRSVDDQRRLGSIWAGWKHAVTRWHGSLQCSLFQKRETSLSLYLAVIRSTERPAIFGSDPPMKLRDASEPRHTRQSSSNFDAFSPRCDRPRAKYRDVMFETCGVSSLVQFSNIMGSISRHRIWQSHHSLFPGA